MKTDAVDEGVKLDTRYKALFETSQDALMLLDRDRFFDCNPATLKMFGLTREIFIKLHPSEISPPRQANGVDSRTESNRMIEEAFKKGSTRFDWIHRRSNGEDFPATVRLTAINVDGKQVLHATVREITPSDESQIDLEAHRLKLQMLLDRKSEEFRKENVDRKKAESELKKLIKAVETSFNAIALFDMDMKFIYANQAFCKMASIDGSEIRERNARDFIPRESFPGVMKQIEAEIAGREVERFEINARNAKGQDMWVEISGSVLFDENGEPDGLLAIINDISERRAIQEALRDSEEKFKTLVENSLDGILIIQDGKIAYINPALARMSGFNTTEQIGKNFIDYVAPEHRDMVILRHRARLQGEHVPPIYETILLAKDGSRVPIEINATVMEYQGKKADFVYVRDLTQRLKAEEDIRTLMAQFEYALGATNTRFSIIDEDFNVVYVDPDWVRKLGDYFGKKCHDYFMGLDHICDDCSVLPTFRTGKINVEERYLKDEDRYIEVHNIPLHKQGDKCRAAKFVRDITERKKMLDGLEESEAKFRNLVESNPLGMLMYTLESDGRLVFTGANPAANLILGVDSSKFIGKTIEEAFPALAKTEIPDAYREVARTGKAWHSDQVIYEEGGITGIYQVNAFQTSPGKMAASFEDITEYKRFDEENSRLKEQFEYVLGATKTGFDIIDEDYNVVYVDPGWVKKLGDYSGKKCHEYFMGKDRVCDKCAIPMALQTGKTTVSEEYLSIEDRYIEVHTIPLKTGGNKRLVAEFNIDITERKKMLKVLETSESKYRNLVETTGTGYVVLNDAGEVLAANDEYLRMTGHSNINDILGRKVTEWTAPHDLKRNAAAVKECFKKGIIRNLEIDYIWEDETVLPIELNATTLEIDGSKQIITLCKDITLRRQSEKALRESEERFRRIFENGPLGMITLNRELRFTSANSAFCKMIGYSADELKEITFKEITHPDHLSQDSEAAKKLIAKKIPMYKTEKRYIRKDGGEIWAAITVTLIHDSNGVFQHFLTLIEDITQRKAAEEALQNTTEQLKSINENLADGMVYQINVGSKGDRNDVRVTYISPAVEKLHKITRDEVMRNPALIYSQIVEVDRNRLMESELKAFAKMGKVDEIVRVILPSGEMRWRQFVSIPRKLENGDIVWEGIETDVTQRKMAEESLHSTTEQLKSISENLADGMVYQINGGKDGKTQNFTYLSPAVERMRSLKLEDAMKNPQLLYDQVLEEDRERLLKTRAETFAKREKLDIELRIRLPNGDVRWRQFVSVPHENSDGEVIWNGIELDITDRKMAEELLAEKETRYKELARGISSGVAVYRAVDDGKDFEFVDFNKAAENIEKIAREKVIGKRVTEMFPGVKKMGILDVFKRVWKTGKPENFPTSLYKDERLESWRENYVYKLPSGEIVAVYDDVTEKKRNEEKIRASQKRYSEMLESITDGFVAFDSEMNYIYLNVKGAEILGKKPEELMGKNYWQEFPEARGTPFEKAYLEALKKRKPIVFENYYQPWNRWFENRIYPTEEGIAIYFTETTERKKAEQLLKENEAKYRTLMEKANDAIFLADAETGILIDVNQKACELTGYSREEMIGMHQTKLHPSDESKNYSEIFKDHVKNTSAIKENIIVQRKDGHIIPISISASVIEINGRLVNQGIFHDLTERVNAEKALREADEKIRTIFTSMEDLIFGFDREGKFISVQTPSEGILYMPEKEFIGKKYSDVMPPHVTKLIKNGLKANMDRRTMDFEYDLEMGGWRRWFSAKMSPIFFENEFHGSVAVVRDITEKKRTEEALASSREQLNAIFQASTNGIGVEKDGKLFFVNQSFVTMFGYSNPGDVIGQPLNTIVAEKDRKRVKGYSKMRIKGEAPPKYEFTGVRKDGSTFDAEASVSTYQIGGEDYFVGFVQDITERKKSQEKVKESEARFRNMAENIHDGLTIIENGKVSYINNRASEIYGYPKEELMNKSHFDLVIPEDREQLKGIIENARNNNQRIGELEFWIQAKDGSRRYVRTRLSTSEDGDGRREFVITTDITARKLAEDETKRRMMKFLLEDGRMYMVKEFRPEMSVEAFNDLLSLDYLGMVMSRTPKKDVTKSVKGGFEYLWLGDREEGKELFDEILATVNELGGKSAILIERLDYLIFKYGFKETMSLIYRLRDIIYLKEQIVILSLDPSTMAEDQIAVIQKEMGEIELRQTPKPPEELFEIAQVIYDRNSTGVKPSFSEVGEELKMSKPTCRKRVRRLIAAGYAIEVTKGNRKVLELTQKGRSLFFK